MTKHVTTPTYAYVMRCIASSALWALTTNLSIFSKAFYLALVPSQDFPRANISPSPRFSISLIMTLRYGGTYGTKKHRYQCPYIMK